MGKEIHYISINPDLVHEFGHFLQFDLRIKEALKEGSFSILANKQCSAQLLNNYPNLYPVFRKTTFRDIPLPDFESLHSFKSGMRKFCQNLTAEKTSTTVFYMYMGSVWHAFAILELIHAFPTHPWTFHINLFLHKESYLAADFQDSRFFPEYKKILQTLITHPLGTRIKLYADTNLAIETLQNHFELQLGYWPMFTITKFGEKETLHQNKNSLVAVYAGNVQANKGFDLIVDWLAKTNLERENIVFRCRSLVSYYQKIHLDWVKSISLNPQVELIEGTLTDQEYIDLIESADFILIPYKSYAFKGRTSGIFVDALERCKPVVVASDTWMGDITRRFENGVVFKDGDVESFAEKINSLVENFAQYQEKANTAKQIWNATNGIDNFIKILKPQTVTITSEIISLDNERAGLKKMINQRKDGLLKRTYKKFTKLPITFKVKRWLRV